MTREEAKELLTHMMMTYIPKDQYGDYDDTEPYEQAIDMAIEALSVVRCKECKYYRAETGSCTAEHWDLSLVTFPHIEPNGYCSYGKNKK